MADFAGGSGTQADPYLIQTAQQLQNIGNTAYVTGNYYFKLIADIDMSTLSSYNPIGNTSSTMFVGKFDGNGHKIQNSTKQIFNYINNSTIKNLEITGSTITGDSALVSGIQISTIMTCYIISNVTITNCCITDSTITSSASSGYCRIGGFVGYANSTGNNISNCYVDNVTITRNSIQMYGGLIVGGIGGGNINCGNVSNVYVSNEACNSFRSGMFSNGSVIYGLVGLRGSAGYSNYGYISNSIFIGNNIPDEFQSGWNAGHFITSYNGGNDIFAHVSNCYHASTAIRGTTTYPSTGTTTNQIGAPTTEYNTQAFYQNTLNWDFDNIWYWDSTDNLPKLRVFQPSTAPQVKTKVSGAWKDVSTTKVKVNGVWKDVTAIKTKVSGVWKDV